MNSDSLSEDPHEVDYLIYNLERLYRMLVIVRCDQIVLEMVAKVLSIVKDVHESCCLSNCGPVPRLVIYGRRGRPFNDIRREQLEYLLRLHFSCPQVAELIGVSLSTLWRRMTYYGLSVGSLYSDVTDNELDMTVLKICNEFPNCGYRLMEGHLISVGIRVTQARIRESMYRVDPQGLAVRWAATIKRCKYFVPSPLSLWHIDGNHNLISYT